MRAQLPGGGEFIVAQEAEIMIPAPFMRPLGSWDYGSGNVYEMRIYTYEGGVPDLAVSRERPWMDSHLERLTSLSGPPPVFGRMAGRDAAAEVPQEPASNPPGGAVRMAHTMRCGWVGAYARAV